jgi:hypothetical protein
MSFAGILFVCWLGIGGVAFIVFSGLGRLTARGDVEADLAIVGDAELRVLVGGRDEHRPSLEARLAQFAVPSAQFAVPSAQVAWMSGDGVGAGGSAFASSRYTTSTGAGYPR